MVSSARSPSAGSSSRSSSLSRIPNPRRKSKRTNGKIIPEDKIQTNTETDDIAAAFDRLKHSVTQELHAFSSEIGSLTRLNRDSLALPTPPPTPNTDDHPANLTLERAPSSQRDAHRTPKWSRALHRAYGNGKVFVHRESPLTQLLDKVHEVQSIYGAIFVYVVWSLLLRPDVFAHLAPWAFASTLEIALGLWVTMLAAVAGPGYVLFRRKWAGSVLVYTLFQVAMMVAAVWCCLAFKLPPASGLLVMVEEARFAMKLHSFFRAHVNGDPALRLRQIPEDEQSNVLPTDRITGTYGSYLYFLFAPTLLYRPAYPRTRVVRWGRVLQHFVETVLCALFLDVALNRHILPHLPPIPATPIGLGATVLEITSMLSRTMLASMMCFVVGFFAVLHALQNLGAELLRFADRDFYKPWWNCSGFAEFYRTWNGVVHDFIFNHLYMDIMETVSRGGTKKVKPMTASTIAVLIIEFSAVIHEVILGTAFGYFWPLCFTLFGVPGVIFMQIKPKRGAGRMEKWFHNSLLWAMLLLGTGILVTFYTMESHLRYVRDFDRPYSNEIDWNDFFSPMTVQYIGQRIGV
ncbi:MBOAT, membrane-bound O-acyltransferase family-domain-containing protein [Cladochytrium replicatum]|nr:MBOAT, membrane-bound O-acyltransferase family-domain-containing protein [Cladochytrium replicatum]